LLSQTGVSFSVFGIGSAGLSRRGVLILLTRGSLYAVAFGVF
jgi:hypothetical protein